MTPNSRDARTRWATAILLVVALLCAGWWARPYVHAVRLLRALQSGEASGEIVSGDLELRSGSGAAIKARAYFPAAKHAPVLVLVHGIHHLGIEDPRLKAFARAMAREGVLVITPEVPGMKDYRVAPEDIDVIGESVLAVQRLTGAKQVGLMGLSFSGGLSLMAAADPRYRPAVGYVIAVGAHASMQRVARFYGSDKMLEPDGRELPFAAHAYGQLVMVYEHPEDYFAASAASPEQVRAVLRPFLYGDVKTATEALAQVPEPARSTLQRWIGHDHDRKGLGAEIVAEAEKRRGEMEQVSPQGHLAGLQAPVLLLHGAGDNVIPPSETEFLAREIPPNLLDEELVSKAISHVDMAKPKVWDQVRLLRWMGEMFRVMERGSFECQRLKARSDYHGEWR